MPFFRIIVKYQIEVRFFISVGLKNLEINFIASKDLFAFLIVFEIWSVHWNFESNVKPSAYICGVYVTIILLMDS